MTRDPRYDILFEPVKIGPKTMKNRFYQAPHATGFSGDASPRSQARFREIKAEGGWAVINTSGLSVHPEHDCWGGSEPHSRLWDEDDARNWSLMCDAVHKHNALAGAELVTTGGGSGFESRLPIKSVSGTIHDTFWAGACYEMDKDDIRDLQQSYVRTAELARSAGFDIINFAAMQGATIPLMFLMKYFNNRTDEYGGSFENRARFALETLEMLREAVGDNCAITCRFAADTLHGTDQGIRVEQEGAQFIQMADHLVDFWDLQVGGETLAFWPKDTGPSRFFEENFQGKWIEKVRPYTSKPIVTVGWLTSPDTMVDLIQSGKVDIIGAARSSIADPYLPKKIEEGRQDEIRECVGCNVCVDRYGHGGRIICTQNATTGEEYRRGWHPENFNQATNHDQDVLIVGAGPAGLECAIVLAARGFDRIHVVEARDEVGGHLNWVAELPGMSAWRRVIDYRKMQLSRHKNIVGVTHSRLAVDDVIDYGAKIIVVATGSYWSKDGWNRIDRVPIKGADADIAHILTPDQIALEGKKIVGKRVLIYDCEGYFMGATMAEKIAREGFEVSLVTPFPGVGPTMDWTGENLFFIPQLKRLGVELFPGHLITEFKEGSATGFQGLEPDKPVTWTIDSVVLVSSRVPNDKLYRELKNQPDILKEREIEALYRIGDCFAPRLYVADAIFDGHRLAREIDSENPTEALPYKRERTLV
ncbi:MAG: FAD-dependent oxidoreductase [Anaerolineales bacterium]